MKLLRLRNRPLHAVDAWREDDLGAIRGGKLPTLNAHGVGHGQHQMVAAGGGDKRQPDAGVAAGRLDDGATRQKKTALLSVVNHRQRNPVLHAAARIEVLDLGQNTGATLVKPMVSKMLPKIFDMIDKRLADLNNE